MGCKAASMLFFPGIEPKNTEEDALYHRTSTTWNMKDPAGTLVHHTTPGRGNPERKGGRGLYVKPGSIICPLGTAHTAKKRGTHYI